ncbi:site-specific integrase [Antribacter sp. KLBMP9083]|uniref:Site-specific integrase n=1 Tax=Antribacter soli TaxID=2910976 RepID=A0AA41U7M4_9MICO|nr:site-specific integrase [Antribacter soli]MCF4121741.1 site-specific integrase [Antribacter soli]
MGSVQKRVRTLKNGKQSVTWVARWREPGTDKQPGKSFPKKGLAEAFLSEIEADILRGEYIAKDSGRVTFGEFARRWLASRTFAESTREAVEMRLRVHILPVLGGLALADIKPTTVQRWLLGLDGEARNYREVLFQHVASIFAAAVDDELIRRNPCKAKSVARPGREQNKVKPWSMDQVLAMREALRPRYRIVVTLGAGLGLRQGEIFGLAVEDIDFERARVTVRRQVKLSNTSAHVRYFGLPKGEKIREVPLPAVVAHALREHLAEFPAREVSLPWGTSTGPTVSARLVVTSQQGRACRRDEFNRVVWAKGRRAVGIPGERENGCHMLRHVYASTLLHAGESIKALSQYLGHSDPGFTLRTYTHFLPESDERTRRAVDEAFGAPRVHPEVRDAA